MYYNLVTFLHFTSWKGQPPGTKTGFLVTWQKYARSRSLVCAYDKYVRTRVLRILDEVQATFKSKRANVRGQFPKKGPIKLDLMIPN